MADPALNCVCGHAALFHEQGTSHRCDMCGCSGYLRLVRRCLVCGRDTDRDPWPHEGFLCGHCDDVTHGLQQELFPAPTQDGPPF